MVFLPHTNTVILLEPYCGTMTEPGLPVACRPTGVIQKPHRHNTKQQALSLQPHRQQNFFFSFFFLFLFFSPPHGRNTKLQACCHTGVINLPPHRQQNFFFSFFFFCFCFFRRHTGVIQTTSSPPRPTGEIQATKLLLLSFFSFLFRRHTGYKLAATQA